MDVRVKHGATLLDQALPGWHRKVRLDRLRMHFGDSCVLGQVARSQGLGGYYEALGWLGLYKYGDSRRLGFIGVSYADYRLLEREWSAAVLARQEGDPKAGLRQAG